MVRLYKSVKEQEDMGQGAERPPSGVASVEWGPSSKQQGTKDVGQRHSFFGKPDQPAHMASQELSDEGADSEARRVEDSPDDSEDRRSISMTDPHRNGVGQRDSDASDSLLVEMHDLRNEEPIRQQDSVRRSPRKPVARSKPRWQTTTFTIAEDSSDEEDGGDGDDSGLSDFVVSDSASETELQRGGPVVHKKPLVRTTRRQLFRSVPSKSAGFPDEDSDDEVRITRPARSGRSSRRSHDRVASTGAGTDAEGNDKENVSPNRHVSGGDICLETLTDNLDNTLKITTPDHYHHKSGEDLLKMTPPGSPSPPILKSPVRNKVSIPKTPYRQSIDKFWDQHTINDWNDEHSPKKRARPEHPLLPIFFPKTGGKSPVKSTLESDDDEVESGIEDAIESPDSDYLVAPESLETVTMNPGDASSPAAPADVAEEVSYQIDTTAKHRRFKKEGRYSLARAFLAELIERVSLAPLGQAGIHKVDDLVRETGGVGIVWSKTLNKTAGRARVSRTPNQLGGGRPPVMRMSIELAEKVLDMPEQVMQTMAHEFAHLCNMAENPKAPAHGEGFKKWARRVEKSLRTSSSSLPGPIASLDVDIKITTKHNYQIAYKYVWACTVCGATIGRHSKSVQPNSIHTPDGGWFVQIKPKLRGVAPAVPPPKPASLPPGASATYISPYGPRHAGPLPPHPSGSSPTAPKPNAWQAFRKQHFNDVKDELESDRSDTVKLGEVMAELSKRWKLAKEMQQQHQQQQSSQSTAIEDSTGDSIDPSLALPSTDDESTLPTFSLPGGIEPAPSMCFPPVEEDPCMPPRSP